MQTQKQSLVVVGRRYLLAGVDAGPTHTSRLDDVESRETSVQNKENGVLALDVVEIAGSLRESGHKPVASCHRLVRHTLR